MFDSSSIKSFTLMLPVDNESSVLSPSCLSSSGGKYARLHIGFCCVLSVVSESYSSGSGSGLTRFSCESALIISRELGLESIGGLAIPIGA